MNHLPYPIFKDRLLETIFQLTLDYDVRLVYLDKLFEDFFQSNFSNYNEFIERVKEVANETKLMSIQQQGNSFEEILYSLRDYVELTTNGKNAVHKHKTYKRYVTSNRIKKYSDILLKSGGIIGFITALIKLLDSSSSEE